MDASAILYPWGNRRSNEVIGSRKGVSGIGESGGGVSSMIAGGYRLRKCLMEGVNDPLFDNRTGGGDNIDIMLVVKEDKIEGVGIKFLNGRVITPPPPF